MTEITGVALLLTLGHHMLGQYGSVIADVQKVVPLNFNTSALFLFLVLNSESISIQNACHYSRKSGRVALHPFQHSRVSCCICNKLLQRHSEFSLKNTILLRECVF